MRGLEFTTLHLPFGPGENQKPDERALAAPALASAIDVQFDEHQGLQTRLPYVALAGAADIFGGGTISNPRRIEPYGDELVLFTKDSIYSRLASQSKWVFRSTHLAIALEERPAFTTTGDQYDGDRAELGGVVLFAWVDTEGLWVAAQDKTTRSTLMASTLANAVGTRPRFVVCSTKILLFWVDTAAGDLEVIAIDPTSPATAIAGAATTVFAASNSYYDVVKVPGADTAIGAIRRTVTTSYEVFKVTQALAVTTATKARTADGPLAVSCEPTGTSVQIVRGNGTNVQGDRLTISSLADAATGQAIGTVTATPINQIAAAHRSVQDSGAYRCYAFWSAEETTSNTSFECKYNYVDTGGGIGTQAVLALRLGVASRAFDHEGRVFVWTAFGGQSGIAGMGEPLGVRAQLQNTYFLYRDDATLHSRSVWQRGGGLAASTGRLPHVSLITGSATYAWCGTERRVIPLGPRAHTGYADRGPVDVEFTFDSDDARRCARSGATLYISGGIVLQFDGESVVEVNYLVYPWFFAAVQIGGGVPAIPDGAYSYKSTLRWQNAKGERDRSTTATGEQLTIAAGPAKVDFSIAPLHVTFKTGTRRPPAIEIWRTKVNPLDDSPFFLDTSTDPATLAGDNRYIPNAPTSAFAADGLDNLTDAVLGEREANPENGGILEALAPPPARIIAAYGDRVWLGRISGAPRQLWYSRLRASTDVASFHDQNVIELPPEGGEEVQIAFMDGIPVVLCERAVFMIPGEGYDNNGGGSNYGPVRCVAYDVGCRDADSVAVTPEGIVFQSSKGKQILTRGWTVKPIGLEVTDRDSETVLAAHVDERRHIIKWLTASRLIAFDYLANGGEGAWTEWTITSGIHACVWNGTHHVLKSTGPLAEQTSYTGTSYGLDVETAWIRPAGLQGRCHLRMLQALGELVSDHWLRVRASYNDRDTVVDDKVLSTADVSGLAPGDPLQFGIAPSRPSDLVSVKLRISAHGTPTQAVCDIPADFAFGNVSLNTPSGNWTAQLEAAAVRPGELGNALGFAISFVTGTAVAIDVLDHAYFDPSTGLWVESKNTVGVKVTGNDTTATVAIGTIEAAIDAGSQLASVSTNHASPAATVNFATMAGLIRLGAFADGAFAAPTDACLKLTGLSLEVGMKHGLYPRLSAAQKV